MNQLTWLDLFRFLNERASDMHNLGKFNWQAPVVIHDAETGEELDCDTYYINDDRGSNRFVLMTNMEKTFDERS